MHFVIVMIRRIFLAPLKLREGNNSNMLKDLSVLKMAPTKARIWP
jgi:hypothetical protein